MGYAMRMHCTKCHHEWDERLGMICDWCGAKGKIIKSSEDWTDDITFNNEIEHIEKKIQKL